MSHVVIIIQQTIQPPPAPHSLAPEGGSMSAEVTYTPPDSATEDQIGNQVERIVKRLAKLAESGD